jgi:hypothetical protein
MNNITKFVLSGLVAFGARELYKLYQIGEEIIYTPVGVSFSSGLLKVKMKLENPIDKSLKMRGIDGKISTGGKLLGTFSSAPFVIKSGVSYFNLDFKVNPINAGMQLISALINKSTPPLDLSINKKIPVLTLNEKFTIDPKKLSV